MEMRLKYFISLMFFIHKILVTCERNNCFTGPISKDAHILPFYISLKTAEKTVKNLFNLVLAKQKWGALSSGKSKLMSVNCIN